MVSRWWNQWIWSSERRRHGRAIRDVLKSWRPAASPDAHSGDREGLARGGPETGAGPWVGDEELVTGILALLWQGASARDLARWLEGPLVVRYQCGAAAVEIEELAEKLVTVYESEIFGED